MPVLPLSSPYMHGFVPTPDERGNPFLEGWLRWDATWYLSIAQSGYRGGDGSVAFFPLYPLLTRGVGWLLGGRYLWAGLIVSNLAAVAFFAVLARLVSEERGQERARPALEAFLAFPTAFFLLMPYTESRLVGRTTAAFYFWRKDKWFWAGLLGALAALTRPHGVFLFPAFGLAWLLGKERRFKALLPLALIPAATLLFGAYASLVVEHGPFWAAQQWGWGQHWAWPWMAVWEGLRNFGAVGPAVLFSLLSVCLVGIPLVMGIKQLAPPYWVYSFLVLGLCMAKVDAEGVIVSMHRFVLMVFPAFILLGEILSRRRLTWFVWRWLGFTVEAFCVVAFTLWGGVW
jgi:hypothetical protein